MKAEKTRQLLDELDCQACGYAKEMLEKGLCFHSCEDHYRLEEEIETELTELERLAEIGQATEIAYSKGAMLIYDICENYEGEIYSYNSDADIGELLEWLEVN